VFSTSAQAPAFKSANMLYTPGWIVVVPICSGTCVVSRVVSLAPRRQTAASGLTRLP
jgi:hypothetical protein